MNTKLASESRTVQRIDSEDALIARARHGEEEAFAALYELHKRSVYSLCLRITGAAEEAEELTRRAFLGVFRRISAFKAESEFGPALNELAINLAVSARHKRNVSQRPGHLPEEETGQGKAEDPVCPSAEGKAGTSRVKNFKGLGTCSETYARASALMMH